MCGIFGCVSVGKKIEESEIELFHKGLAQIVHRGPDGYGSWLSEKKDVFLGHRRLSIIDLSEGGKQPMFDDNNVIVFNGEIYNYIDLKDELAKKGVEFHSSSDTEVLLKLYKMYGPEFVKYLNGMFSFAIYDSEKNKIICARDRAGEKPFFYKKTTDGFYFSSELKSLFAINRGQLQINEASLVRFFEYGYVAGSACLVEGYSKLPPAHLLELDLYTGNARIVKFWDLPEYTDKQLSFAEVGDNLDKLVKDSVNRQLIADVPVGVLLSGGVDSSLITAYASQFRSNIKTFTIRFPSYGRYDETEHARLVANHFGTDHYELSAADVSFELLPELAAQYDEPIIDSSMIPTSIVSQLVSKHCKVALGGDGGDELFGGYQHYSRLLRVKQMQSYIPSYLLPVLKKVANVLPAGFKGKNWLSAAGENLNKTLPVIAKYFDAKSINSLFDKSIIGKNDSVYISDDDRWKKGDVLQWATRLDFLHYLPEDILVKVDRASMLYSLELRAPFLDYRIIDFAFSSIPSKFKATSNERKMMLKYLCAKHLPKNFDSKRKQGFSIPLGTWLKEKAWKDRFEEVLYDEQSLFNKTYVKELFRNQDLGASNSERLFSLVIFELWRRKYNIQLK